MKRLFPIPCICSIVLLSSCTLTQQQAKLSEEDIAAQTLAASELDAALIVEEKRLIKEAREEEKRRVREEAEAKAREEEEAKAEAEAKAREEAEASSEEDEITAEGDRTPQLLSSRRRKKAQVEPVTPTAEQQEAARRMLAAQQKKAKAKKADSPPPAREEDPEPEQEEMQLPGSELSGGLRTRRFAPPEEAISRDDDDEPLPNSVELRGLRSPVMKGNLPMNIDGKIIKED